MPYKSTVYRVMIASPSDVVRERQITRDVIHEWNTINSEEKEIILIPTGWETDSSPIMGDRPQEIIIKQVLNKCDLLVGIFWTRIGTPTGEAISGTVEEIEKHINLGKPAMIYFSSVPVVPESLEREQYDLLLKFRDECKSRGLFETFSSPEDFQKKFSKHIQLTINHNEYFVKNKIEDAPIINSLNNRESIETIVISEEAKIILIEAANDQTGNIMRLYISGGRFVIQSNNKRLNPDDNPRTQAIWSAAIDELVSMELIEDTGYKGEVFRITKKGYQFVDIFSGTSDDANSNKA